MLEVSSPNDAVSIVFKKATAIEFGANQLRDESRTEAFALAKRDSEELSRSLSNHSDISKTPVCRALATTWPLGRLRSALGQKLVKGHVELLIRLAFEGVVNIG